MLLAWLVSCAPEQCHCGPLPKWPDRPLPPHGETVTERFVVRTPDRSDALLALDPSLAAGVTESLPALTDHLLGSGLDWRIGLVSTSLGGVDAGRLLPVGDGRWIDAGTLADPVGALVDAPPYGALGATFLALDADVDGFRRPDADLHVLLAQAGDDETPPSLIDPGEWETWIAAFAPGVGRSVTVVAGPDATVLPEVGAVADDLGDALARVGEGHFDLEFFLRLAPVPQTLEVEVRDEDQEVVRLELDEELVYDEVRNSVAFVAFVPADGAEVEATYVPQ